MGFFDVLTKVVDKASEIKDKAEEQQLEMMDKSDKELKKIVSSGGGIKSAAARMELKNRGYS